MGLRDKNTPDTNEILCYLKILTQGSGLYWLSSLPGIKFRTQPDKFRGRRFRLLLLGC